MTTVHNRLGLIILGNSGVGKSFLANILLGRDAFKHESTCTAVTTKTEFYEVTFEERKYVIFNIPGLIEAQQTHINRNKEEIDKAFQQCANAVIIYVFGNQNGRIRNEDIIAFNALNDAYPFKNKSLILVVNCIPPLHKRGNEYEGKTTVLLRQMLNFKEWENICFLDEINGEDEKIGKQKLCEKLLPSILASMPNVHVKQHDIHLEADKIKELMEKYNNLTGEFYKQQAKHQKEIHLAQEKYEHKLEEQGKEFKKLVHTMKKEHKRELKEQREEIEDLMEEQQERNKVASRQKQKEPDQVGAGQKQQERDASGATNSKAIARGIATAATAAVAAAPFGPFAMGAAGTIGFYVGSSTSD